MDDGASVELSISASESTGAMDVAAQKADKLGQSVKTAGDKAAEGSKGIQGFDAAGAELAKHLETLVGAAAIEEFFRHSIEEALHAAESYRILSSAILATGKTYEDAAGKVREFAEAQESSTRFAETDTVAAVSKVIKVTGDLNQAMTAVALAQNVSVGSGKDFGESLQLVSSLLSGQQRGVMMARREFAAYVGDSNNATDVLAKLQKGFDGAAAAEESATKTIAESRNEIKRYQEEIGTGLLPVLEMLSKGAAMILRGFREIGTVVGGALAEVTVALDGVGRAMVEMFKGNARALPQIMKETMDQIKEIDRMAFADIEKIDAAVHEKKRDRIVETAALHAKKSEEQRVKEEELAAVYLSAVDDTYGASKAAIDKEIADLERAGITKFNIVQDGVRKEITLEQLANAQHKKLEQEKMAFVATSLGTISSLSSAKTKEIAMIGKAAAFGQAIISAHEGAAKAVARVEMFPFNFVLAGLIEAAGLAQAAQIAGVPLEVGGVVPGTAGGTPAIIGEKGRKEAVLPLENAASMEAIRKAIGTDRKSDGPMKGGDTFVFQNTFMIPGLEAARDPEVARAILQILADQMERRTPDARTVARRTVDVAEMFSERSA